MLSQDCAILAPMSFVGDLKTLFETKSAPVRKAAENCQLLMVTELILASMTRW